MENENSGERALPAAASKGKKGVKTKDTSQKKPKLHDKFEVSHASENLSCGECCSYISRRSLMMRRHTKVSNFFASA